MAVGLGKLFPKSLPSSSSTWKEQRDRRARLVHLGPIAQGNEVQPADTMTSRPNMSSASVLLRGVAHREL